MLQVKNVLAMLVTDLHLHACEAYVERSQGLPCHTIGPR